MTVYAYYRVSTEKQDYNSQKLGVVEYCNRAGLKIEEAIKLTKKELMALPLKKKTPWYGVK